MHQFPQAGSFYFTATTVLDIMHWWRVFLTSSSQFFVPELALLLIILQPTWSHLHTGRCPTSLPWKENIVRHLIMLGTFGIILPCFHCTLSQHPCAVLQPFQPKLSQIFSDVDRRHDILVDVVDVSWCCAVNGFFLQRHCADNGLHDKGSHI